MNEALNAWETAMVAELACYEKFVEAVDGLSDESINQLATAFEAFRAYRDALNARRSMPAPTDCSQRD